MKPAEGLVIESHCDPRRGISAVVVIRNGTLRSGEYMVAGPAYAPLRIMENFLGKPVKEARFSSPLMVVGFSGIPPVGAVFTVVPDKKTAVAVSADFAAAQARREHVVAALGAAEEGVFVLPVIVKADVVGSIDALKHEFKKIEDEYTKIVVVSEGVGAVTEGDVKNALCDKNTIVLGFNVSTDAPARELAERHSIEVASFSIIYDLADWLSGAIAARRPKVAHEEITGRAKVLKSFSYSHKAQTIGARVEFGALALGDTIRFVHNGEVMGIGHIKSLKSGMSDVREIREGNDCGMQIEVPLEKEPVYEDEVIAYRAVER